MSVAVASGQPFYGMKTFPGRVMYVSNEWSDEDEVCRIWYEKTRNIATGRIDLVRSGPLLEWGSVDAGGRRKNVWEFTRRGSQILRRLEHTNPDLIILDTVLGLCSGVEQLNNSMTYALGDLLQKEIGTKFGAALIAVAHTSQSSSKESLEQRLHYAAMAGGNGLPGALRMMIGLTKVQPSDFGTEAAGFSRNIVAVGSSKFNVDGFRPLWTNNEPGYFTWGQTGLEYDPNPYSAIIGSVEPAETRKEKAVLKGGKSETYF
jgi:RecA-family ATPase